MGTRFKGKKVVVIGGEGVPGVMIALAFAREGADIIITYYADAKLAHEVVNQIQGMGRRAKAISMNSCLETDCTRVLDECYQFIRDVDILVNSANFLTRGSFTQLSHETIKNTFEVNMLAPILLMQKIARRMKVKQELIKQAGQPLKDYRMINCTLTNDTTALSGISPYVASMAALSSLMQSIAKELAPYKIRVHHMVSEELNRSSRQISSSMWKSSGLASLSQCDSRLDEWVEKVLSIAKSLRTTPITMTVDSRETGATNTLVNVDNMASVEHRYSKL